MLYRNRPLYQARYRRRTIHDQGFLRRQRNQGALGRGKTCRVKDAVAQVGDFLRAPIVAAPILCKDYMVRDRTSLLPIDPQ